MCYRCWQAFLCSRAFSLFGFARPEVHLHICIIIIIIILPSCMLSQDQMLVKSFFSSDKTSSSESDKKLVPGSVQTSSDLAERNPTEDLEFASIRSFEKELPSIQLSDIVAATKNFSRECMVGRGGFGKVYKVTFRVSCPVLFSANLNSRTNTQLLLYYYCSEGDTVGWP